MSAGIAAILAACVLSQAQPLFTDVTANSGIPQLKYSEGVCMSDLDGDGLPELYLPDVKGPDRLFKNLGGLRFCDITAASGITVSGGIGAAVADLDGDGNKDIYVVRGAYPYGLNVLYMGAGGGRFMDVSESAGVVSRKNGIAPVLGDYDADGDPDIFIANWGPDTLYSNTGAPGKPAFTDVSEPSGAGADGRSWAAVFSDFDGDARPDLFVARGGQGNSDRSVLYINRGGVFVDATEAAGLMGISGMGAVSADFDCDGDSDLFVTCFEGPDRLFKNDGKGVFTDKTEGAGIDSSRSVGAAAGDVDGDLLPDLVVGGFAGPVRIFRNIGGGRFSDASQSYGIKRRDGRNEGVCLGDLDGDGDLDLYVANYAGHNALYRNELDPKRPLRVRPFCGGREAVGARVSLYRDGALLASVECNAQAGFCSQAPVEALFALPGDGSFELRVVFPGGVEVVKKGTGPGELVVERDTHDDAPDDKGDSAGGYKKPEDGHD